MSCQGYRGYISSHMIERSVPQSVQQLVIREYCKKNGLEFLLSATEYCDGFVMLHSLLQDKNIDGIVFYSIFQLPVNEQERGCILASKRLLSNYMHIKEKRIPLYFAAENIKVTSDDEAKNLEDIFLVRKILYGNN